MRLLLSGALEKSHVVVTVNDEMVPRDDGDDGNSDSASASVPNNALPKTLKVSRP